MIRFIIAFVIVGAILFGSLLALRRTRMEMPSQDVIDRVKLREREIEARERTEKED